jgi:cytochrome P450
VAVLFSLNAKLSDWLTSPGVLRVATAILRRHWPVLRVGSRVFVARHADVKSVLEQSDRFGVTEIYAERMERATGAFLLGWENTPAYQREVSLIRAAVPSGDLARVRALAAQRAEQLLAAVCESGQIDVVSQYARLIPLALVEQYFGVRAPEQSALLRWLRYIFWDLFLNLGEDEQVTSNAVRDGELLRNHLSWVIAEHQRLRGQGSAPDDFVTRLLTLREHSYTELDDEALRRNIGGVIVGAVETQAKAITLALQELLRRPEHFAAARRAALAGDDDLLGRYVFEALRFNPHNPLIVRRCHQDTVFGAGTEQEVTIRRGTTVFALTLSAMFDEQVLEEPEQFRVDRPRQHYLHFGHGQHQCFGTALNYVVVPEAIKHLLRLPQLGISPETPRVEYEGPFPDRFLLQFTPSHPQQLRGN